MEEQIEKKVDFIKQSFKLRNIIHMQHLVTDYYSHHVALNDFYDKFLIKIDDVAENLLNDDYVKKALIENININLLNIPDSFAFDSNDPILTLEGYKDDILIPFKEFLDGESFNSNEINHYSGIINILDEIEQLIEKTNYLLKLN